MNSSQVIGWMIVICLLFMVFIVFSKPLKYLARCCLNGAIGISGIFVLDFLLSPLGIAVGINGYTALITGFLGLPGFISLYAIAWFLH